MLKTIPSLVLFSLASPLASSLATAFSIRQITTLRFTKQKSQVAVELVRQRYRHFYCMSVNEGKRRRTSRDSSTAGVPFVSSVISKEGKEESKMNVDNNKKREIPLATFNKDGTRSSEPMSIPSIGLGTYKFRKNTDEASSAILTALNLGYRHIDTAFIYGGETTEKQVGIALSSISNNIPRSEIFITTKQWRAYHGYQPTLDCLNKSLSRLGLEYVDLYLIHWPGPAYNTMSRRKDLMETSPDGPFVYAKDGHEINNMVVLRAETWRAMEDALFEGKCKAIGVSNFTIRHLEHLKKTARVWPPAVNQVEIHPYYPQWDLVEYCRKEGIVIEAYASLGGQDSGKKTYTKLGGSLLTREEIGSIADKHGKTPAQVLLKWAVQNGFAVIPKSTDEEHLKDNLNAICDDWTLDRVDLDLISTLDKSGEASEVEDAARLCWVRDPLKMLDFD